MSNAVRHLGEQGEDFSSFLVEMTDWRRKDSVLVIVLVHVERRETSERQGVDFLAPEVHRNDQPEIRRNDRLEAQGRHKVRVMSNTARHL